MFSNWTDKHQTGSINSAIEHIMNCASEREIFTDPFDHQKLLYSVEKILPENGTIEINNQNIIYNYLVYRYEEVKNSEITNPLREKRINSYEANIIIYQYDDNINYIIDKSFSSTTRKNLRQLLNYKGKAEIEEKWPVGIKTDLFIWMVHYIINHNGDFIDAPKNTTKIISIVGFKGERQDKLAEINGNGQKIMEMLTTFLFLFENRHISKIETTIEKNNETFKVSLGKRLIDIDITKYTGDDMMMISENLKARVAIKVFVDLLPNLIVAYSDELEKKKWSNSKENKFYREIGRNLSKKINDMLRNRE